MRGLIVVVIVVLIGGAFYVSTKQAPEQARPVAAGSVAPDFQLEDTEGNKVSLASQRGKVVLVNFWATWCPPCKEEMPSMERLNEVMGRDDFVILAINVEKNGRTAVAEFLNKTPYTFPILYDDKEVVQDLYGVFKFPETFIVRKDGVVDKKIIGSIDWSSTSTLAYLKNLTR